MLPTKRKNRLALIEQRRTSAQRANKAAISFDLRQQHPIRKDGRHVNLAWLEAQILSDLSCAKNKTLSCDEISLRMGGRHAGARGDLFRQADRRPCSLGHATRKPAGFVTIISHLVHPPNRPRHPPCNSITTAV